MRSDMRRFWDQDEHFREYRYAYRYLVRKCLNFLTSYVFDWYNAVDVTLHSSILVCHRLS